MWGFHHAHDSPSPISLSTAITAISFSQWWRPFQFEGWPCYDKNYRMIFYFSLLFFTAFVFRSLRFLSVGHSLHPSSTRGKTNCSLRLPDGVPGKSLMVFPSCYDAVTHFTTNYCGRLVSGPVSCEETNGWVVICAISWS